MPPRGIPWRRFFGTKRDDCLNKHALWLIEWFLMLGCALALAWLTYPASEGIDFGLYTMGILLPGVVGISLRGKLPALWVVTISWGLGFMFLLAVMLA